MPGFFDLNADKCMIGTTESGDESGVWSSVIADPSVDIVVVGEEFVDDEADVEMLPCCWCSVCCNDKGPIEPSVMLVGPFWTIVCCDLSDAGEQPDMSTSISNIETKDGTVGEDGVAVVVIIAGAVGDLQKG